jgi:anthranilate phosphoribosyltransferase
MDEISPFAQTNVIELKNGIINEIKIDPNKMDIKFKNPENLKGKDADYNASKIIDIFSGVANEFSEAVCLNSAAALVVSSKIDKFNEAYEYSKEHLKSGKALSHLRKIQTF